MRLFRTGLVLALAAGLAFLGYQKVSSSRRRSQGSYRLAKLTKGDIVSNVSATGTLNAVTTVQVGSQISGNILKLHADFNSIVKADQVVAEIDPATFEAAVAQARADVQAARATLAQATTNLKSQDAEVLAASAGILSAEASVRRAEATFANSELTLGRTTAMREKNLQSQQDVDTARANRNIAAADLDVSRAQLEVSRTRLQTTRASRANGDSQVEATKAQLAQREATLKLAGVNLTRCKILSPIDGIVVSRSVDVGQTVAASLQAPTIFVIANDLKRMQIDANVDEADIGRVKIDQKVEFTVDSYPDDRFEGHVVQMRLQPIVSQNVVTYDTVIAVSNEQLVLRPGMTANVYIQVAKVTGALRVPNAAFSFKPPAGAETPPPEIKPQKKGLRTIHVLQRGRPEAKEIEIGISDGSFTEVLKGELEAGDEVVVGMETDEKAGASGPTNPFAPRRR